MLTINQVLFLVPEAACMRIPFETHALLKFICTTVTLKAYDAYLKKIMMDENDLSSECNKIPLGQNRTNGAVYSKTNFKVEISSAL